MYMYVYVHVSVLSVSCSGFASLRTFVFPHSVKPVPEYFDEETKDFAGLVWNSGAGVSIWARFHPGWVPSPGDSAQTG